MAKRSTPKPSLKRARITEVLIHGSFDGVRLTEKLVKYVVTFGATSSLVVLIKA